MRRYVAGIDGGQSSTVAAILDDEGRLAGRGVAGPADHVGEPAGSTRAADACAAALGRAMTAAGLPHDTRFAAVRVGLSGYDDAFDGARPAPNTDVLTLQHDAPVALAAAVAERPAVVVIAGTGSVAYGEDGAGASVRVGGWGYLFGDEGSAFAVARDALAHAMSEHDRGERAPLGDAALAFFDRPDLHALATEVLLGRISRASLAAFGRVVHDAARLGDPAGQRIVAAAADALAALAATALDRLQLGARPVPVAFSGGAFHSEAFTAATHARLAVLAPDAVAVVPRYEPAIGAALLAFADTGLTVPENVLV